MTDFIVGLVISVGVFGLIWYNAKKAADSEDAEAARQLAEARAVALETQRSAEEKAAAQKDVDEGKDVVASRSGTRGVGWLRDSFPQDRNS